MVFVVIILYFNEQIFLNSKASTDRHVEHIHKPANNIPICTTCIPCSATDSTSGFSGDVTSTSPLSGDDEESRDAYYDEKYWAWQKEMNAFGATYKGDIILSTMGKDVKTIMEFGSSGGFIIENMRNKVRDLYGDSTAYGVEINAAAREHSRRSFPNVKVVAKTASIPSSSIDFAFTTSVLEHVECPVCELRELRRVIKPKGEILVMVVGEGIKRNQDSYLPNDVNYHLHTWTALQLGNSINAAGLEVCGCIVDWSAWQHINIQQYLQSRLQTCLEFKDWGNEIKSLMVRCMAGT